MSVEDEPDFPPTQAPRIWEVQEQGAISAEQVKELSDLADEMIRFGNRHWMHDEGQNVRMFGERIKKILKLNNRVS